MKSYINLNKSKTSQENFRAMVRLLGSEEGIEISQYEIGKNSIFFAAPALLPDTYEFYYIVSGKLVHNDTTYSTYDYIETFNIIEPLKFTAQEDTVVLYIGSKSGEYAHSDAFTEELVKHLDTIQEKDHYTYKHCRSVKRLVNHIAEEMNLPPSEQKNLLLAAYFHDVGKVKTPDHILNKKGKLTSEEYEIMKNHVTHSYEMISSTLGHDIAEIIITHHERLDGSGYPKGIKDIPLLGRILGVADSYDAMTTKRIYQDAKSHEIAIKELLSMNDKYDEKIVHILDKIKKITHKA